MPTYEYECQKCGHQFEEFQSISADPLKSCVSKGCRGKVKRLISGGGGLLFKGSGFYITDYRSDGYKKAEKADRKESSDSSGDKAGGKSKGDSKADSTSSPSPKKETASKTDT